jgi:hypothetical protein
MSASNGQCDSAQNTKVPTFSDVPNNIVVVLQFTLCAKSGHCNYRLRPPYNTGSYRLRPPYTTGSYRTVNSAKRSVNVVSGICLLRLI